MTLSLYNTLSRKTEPFAPHDPGHVGLYVCGPTVYDFAHLGNARPVVVFDVLVRALRRAYPRVTYVRNITDVDDKIMARAQETGEAIDTITTRTTQAYHEDMAALLTAPPDIEPRATGHIAEMQAMIALLIKRGHAYEAEGHVLFHVPSMPDYGALSRRSRDEQIAGARVDVAPYKRDSADFVLWKPSHAEQPGWDSPWGRGRPGWHIECSAMAKKHLGVTFDIHGGGLDLVFPHHENEIAQSACAHDGAPLARVWMHNGFLSVNGEKMSKSLGNFFTVRELLAQAPGESLRYALLSAHYRQPLDFSLELLQQAKATLDRWYGALRSTIHVKPVASGIHPLVKAAVEDDLNTPLAFSHLHRLVGVLNASADEGAKAANKGVLLASAHALGFLTQDPEIWFRGGAQQQNGPDDAVIARAIHARQAAKAARNFAEADRIRDELAAQGVLLEDTPAGTSWRRG